MSVIPVRCFCRAVVGDKWERFVAFLKEGVDEDAALDRMGVRAPCCRRMLKCHTDTSERLLRYQVMETDNMKASMQSTAGGADEGEDSGGDDG